MGPILTDDRTSPTVPTGQAPRRHSVAMPWVLSALCGAIYFIGAGRSLGYDSSVTLGLFIRPARWFTPLITTHLFNNQTLFSQLEWFVWHAGGRSETALRVAPIVFGAATVGVVAAWAQRRWGLLAGLVAGLLTATNPTLASLSRDVRGYSLATLGVVVATCWLIDHLDDDDPGLSPIYVVAMGVAIGTHFMCLLVLGAHVVALYVARRRGRWWGNVGGALTLGMAPLVPGLADLIDAARTQRPKFLPHFPLELASMVTGVTPLAEVAIGAVLMVAAAQYLRSGPSVSGGRRRRPLLAGALALAVVLGIEWLVLRPPNLDGRFVVWLVPAAAIAVAATLGPRLRPGLRGACAALALVAVVAMVGHQVPTWTTPDLPLREAAAWIRAHRQGGIVCADGSEGEAFLGYGLLPRPLIHADQAYRCELVVQLGPPGPYHVMGAVRAALPRTVMLRGGVTDIRIHHR